MKIGYDDLTPIQNKLLWLITAECFRNGSISISKTQLAKRLNCSMSTIDKAVKTLRDKNYIEVVPQYKTDNGC